MKAYLIQPRYSTTSSDLEKNFAGLLALLDECDDGADVIVLPEYGDVIAAGDAEHYKNAIERNSPVLLARAIETAKRCNAVVFVNCGYDCGNGFRNTTHVIDRKGNVVGRYFKMHPAPSEINNPWIDTDYADEDQDIYVVEVEGIRYAFRTCYDFYFYEDAVQMARKRPDVIIGCSHQRSDSHDALEIMNRHLCYNTNAYLLRASISLGADSNVCGCSMAVSPEGKILANMKNRVGIEKVDIDPKKKFYKPAGFNGAPKAHFEYVDEGRKI